MSFSIDLWNGSNIIKDKYTNLRREFRSFANFLSKYNTYESQHCKNLDYLYNEFKEQNKQIDSEFERARINLIDMINYESQIRKKFLENVTDVVKKINLFLQGLINPLNEIPDLTENFNKEIEKLKTKKEMFYNQCKEMSSLISQLELDNKLKDKSSEPKLNKTLNKLIKSREEYLININETNIKRSNYNKKVEEILDKYEKDYKEILKSFVEYLKEFKTKKKELTYDIYQREESDLNLFTNLNIDKEIINFIIQNATKEFPMIQIEFSPFKKKDFETFLNSKYHNKLKKEDLNKVMTSIKEYFQNNNIFPTSIIQTGIAKVAKPQNDFFSGVRKFSIFLKKNINNNSEDTNAQKNENATDLKEKEINIIRNYEFVKNTINELVSDNKIKIFESKFVIDDDISKIKDNIKNFDNINDKVDELKSLLDMKNESHLVYIEALIKSLSFLRSKGYYAIKDETYDIIIDIFMFILEQNKNNDYILKNVLILSQTFYKLENKEKIYIQEGIKNNKVLNSSKTWHRCINYSLKLANKDLPNNGKEYINKINKDAYTTVITYLCDLKAFTDDEKVYEDVFYFYIKVYNLKEEDVTLNVQNSVNSREKPKEKEKNQNEIKSEIKDEIKTEIKDEIKNEIKNEDNKENKDKNEINEINLNYINNENNIQEKKESNIQEKNDNNIKENNNNINEIKQIKEKEKSEENKIDTDTKNNNNVINDNNKNNDNNIIKEENKNISDNN